MVAELFGQWDCTLKRTNLLSLHLEYFYSLPKRVSCVIKYHNYPFQIFISLTDILFNPK